MAFVELSSSALAPGVSPVLIHYRDVGAGRPLVFLHGGWGYEIYPFDRQLQALAPRPSRRHPGSDRVRPVGDARAAGGRLPSSCGGRDPRRHRRARARASGALGTQRRRRHRVLAGLAAPQRLSALILEATHLFRSKPASREFFDTMMANPDGLGPRVAEVLARDHGERWRDLIRANGMAWRRIADERLGAGRRPVWRKPPAAAAADAAAPRRARSAHRAGRARRAYARRWDSAARFEIFPEGGHSPHSERATSDEVTRAAQRFLSDLEHAASPVSAGR